MNTKESTHEDYMKRFYLVVEYILDNFEKKIDLKILADVSNFSEYLFHRIFKAYIRETIVSYVTQTRIEVAAGKLYKTNDSIEDIAYSVGYEVASFMFKSFQKDNVISQNQYRKDKHFLIMK